MTRIDVENPSIENNLKRASIFKVQYNSELLDQYKMKSKRETFSPIECIRFVPNLSFYIYYIFCFIILV